MAIAGLSKRAMCGFTLLELTLVLVILAAMASMVVPLLGGATEQAKEKVVQASLKSIRDALTGPFISDMKYTPWYQADPLRVRLHDLYSTSRIAPDSNSFSLETQKGWRGPYLEIASSTSIAAGNPLIPEYFDSNEMSAVDPWGNPFVLQYPLLATVEESLHYARIVSAGPDGILQTPRNPATSSYALAKLAGRTSPSAAPARGDDIVLFLNRADVHE